MLDTTPGQHNQRSLTPTLVLFCSALANNSFSSVCMKLLTTVRLVGISKPNGGVRPVLVEPLSLCAPAAQTRQPFSDTASSWTAHAMFNKETFAAQPCLPSPFKDLSGIVWQETPAPNKSRFKRFKRAQSCDVVSRKQSGQMAETSDSHFPKPSVLLFRLRWQLGRQSAPV